MDLAKLKAQLLKLKNHPLVFPEVIKQFEQKITSGLPLTKAEKNPEHLCAFFLPVHQQTRSIYLIDHIKGEDWMPPGGHIEPHELPLETAKREYFEELGFPIGKAETEFIGLTIKPITNHPLNYCTKHYDFWYVVWVDKKHNYQWDKREFHAAGWFGIDEGITKIKNHPDYRRVLTNLKKAFFERTGLLE